MSLMFSLLLAAACFAYYAWVSKKRYENQLLAARCLREFLEQTGFRVVGAEGADLSRQAELALAAIGQEGGAQGHEWVKQVGGVPVRHFFRRVHENGTNFYWSRWSVALTLPPRIALQVIERRLVGVSGSVDNLIENRSYAWRQVCPQRVRVGDPELDRRFLFFGHDPALVSYVLKTDGVRELLLACTQVDLSVDANGVRFSDPFRENLTSAFGAGTGALLSGYDPKFITGAIQPVHERICWLAATLARVCA